ncbi:MAG TPA: AsmA family protein, partial [Candidatus Deferrimicrobiaceae bacterium]|nr:AsmA family protein [Candidatus Deferrimicrobiaceae bacterium]
MADKRKIALFAGGGLFAILLLTVVALLLFLDVNAHKPRLEAAASDALGMEVRIGGRMGIGLFPGFHVTLEDVRIRNRGADVASAKETILGIEL